MIFKILNQYISAQKLAFYLLESLFALGMVIVGAHLSIVGNAGQSLSFYGLLLKAVLIVLSVQIWLYYFDLYDLKVLRSNFEFAIRLLQSLGAASILLALVYYLAPKAMIGDGAFLFVLVLLGATVASWRVVYEYFIKTTPLDQRILIVGSGSFAQRIAQEVIDRMDSGFRVLGFIDTDSDRIGERLVNPAVLGDHSQIYDIALKERVNRIIVALEERRGTFPEAQLLKSKFKGIMVEDGVEFFEHLTGKVFIESLRPSALIFSEGFKRSWLSVWIKRLIGFTLSLTGLVLLSPFILIIAVLIKLDSAGPIFYKQERIGKDGRVFNLLKFRSMVQDAEKDKPVWADLNDQRITRLGKWLRLCRLDELPQMINVLKGDMSFVGPRPERPYFVDQLKKEIPYYDLRVKVKPGITGWAQVRYPYGATKEAALEKLRYDLYYIKNFSPLFDLLIIFETIKVVILGKGAR